MCTKFTVHAQLIVGSYPETRRLYKEAQRFMQEQNYLNAAVALSQALKTEPDNVTFLRELALNYFLDGKIDKAHFAIEEALKKTDSDVECILLAHQIYLAEDDVKAAKKIITKGLAQYPNSGELYNLKGELLYDEKDYGGALNAWETGIKLDPAYHSNYYNAAKIQSRNPNDFVKTIIYSETFINLESFSPRTDEMKTILFNAYVKLINFIKTNSFNGETTSKSLVDFSSAFIRTVSDNMEVIPGDINAGNVTQLRIRFLLDWNKTYDEIFPLELLNYHNSLLVNGYFEAYNQWLFGNEANPQLFRVWAVKNAGVLNDFTKQLQEDKFLPKKNEFYFSMTTR